MVTLKAFVLGTAAGIGVAIPVAILVGILADMSDWSSTAVSVFGTTVWAFERTPAGTSTSYGLGLLVVGLALGLLNAGGSLLLRHQTRRGEVS